MLHAGPLNPTPLSSCISGISFARHIRSLSHCRCILHHFNHRNNKQGNTQAYIYLEPNDPVLKCSAAQRSKSGSGCDSQRGETLPAGCAEGNSNSSGLEKKGRGCHAVSSQIPMNTRWKNTRVNRTKCSHGKTHTCSSVGGIRAGLTAISVCLIFRSAG